MHIVDYIMKKTFQKMNLWKIGGCTTKWQSSKEGKPSKLSWKKSFGDGNTERPKDQLMRPKGILFKQ